jgi:hypothetical protein
VGGGRRPGGLSAAAAAAVAAGEVPASPGVLDLFVRRTLQVRFDPIV